MQFLKHLYILIFILLLAKPTAIAQSNTAIIYKANTYQPTLVAHSFTDSEVINRLRNTQSAVSPRFTDVVRGYLRTYTIKNRSKTERILGKAVMYFPIFETYLRKKGIPDALKYLSVTESALNPTAVSSAKAVGLWQFMKATGKEYGLRIDRSVDERCDPHLSTAAAAEYLHRQYKRFGDWALAIAAYNSGPGNVSKAIRRGRSKNFWKIKKYLPRETRSYVPGYIAAAYILQHYEKHGLIPQYPSMDLQLTEAVKIYSFLNFQTISAMTGIPVSVIRELNPSFLQNYIPATQRGYYLILPKRVMADFKNKIARPDSQPNGQPVYTSTEPIYVEQGSSSFLSDDYTLSYHTVQQQEHLHTIAKRYNCHPYHIKIWNNMNSNYVQAGTQLKIYIPKTALPPAVPLPPRPKREKRTVPSIPSLLPQEIVSESAAKLRANASNKEAQYQYHVIHRYESIRDIAAKYGTTVAKILGYNNITNRRLPMPGDRIKVKIIR